MGNYTPSISSSDIAEKMRILFIHQAFPAQFRHLAPALRREGHEVRALGAAAQPLESVAVTAYSPASPPAASHGWGSDFSQQLAQGAACATAAAVMEKEGWRPDLIIGHPGWGEMLCLRDLWPDIPQLHYLEFYYRASGLDADFDPECRIRGWEAAARLRARNATNLLSLEMMDVGLSPTSWQRSTYPADVQPRIQVIHDGIDTGRLRPDPSAMLRLVDGTALQAGMEIVTFASRNLEHCRGYHRFIRALPRLMALRPAARIVIIGGNDVSYGPSPPPGAAGWKDRYLAEVAGRIDPRRLIFTGPVDHDSFIRLMQISAAHVYLTYPFVLSWSMLEAMSCGTLVIGSRTPPVSEVIADGQNGLLVDFFDEDELAERVASCLAEPSQFRALRVDARQTILQRYDLHAVCLPRQLALIEQMMRAPTTGG